MQLLSGINNSLFRYFVILAVVVSCFLLIPLTAMQFTNEVNWTLFDFVFMWILLVGAGMTFKLVARKMSNVAYRAAVGVAVVAAVLLVWINSAVGIIGDEGNPANLMYFGVLAVGLAGAFIARFLPHGMSRAMFVTAFTQALVPVFALIFWRSTVISDPPGITGLFVLNGFFVLLFAGSAILFRTAAQE